MMNVMLSLRCTLFCILTARTCGASQGTKVIQADEMDDLLLKEIESRLFEESPGHTAVKVLHHQGSRKIKAVESEEVMPIPEASLSLEEGDPSLNLLQTQATKVTEADKTADTVMEVLSLEEEFLALPKVKLLQQRGARKVKEGDSRRVNASETGETVRTSSTRGVVNTASEFDALLEHPVTCAGCEIALSNESDVPGVSLLQTQTAKVIKVQESKDDVERSTAKENAEMLSDSNITSNANGMTALNISTEVKTSSGANKSSMVKTTSELDTLKDLVTCGDCEMALSNDSDMPGLSLLQTQAMKGKPKKVSVKKAQKAAEKKSNSTDDQIAQLVAEASAPAKKTVKVKAKKSKKEAAKALKKAAAAAKKKAAAELKEKKQEAAAAKKKAAAELKEKKDAEKLAKQEAAAAKTKISTETETLSEVNSATEVNTTSNSLNSVDATSNSSIETASDSNISSNAHDAAMLNISTEAETLESAMTKIEQTAQP